MKRALIILAVIIAHCTLYIDNCMSQWVYQALPSYYEISDVKFFDANTGIIIGTTITRGLLRTTNGGFNWSIVKNTYIYGMDKIDSTTLYLVGKINGTDWLYRTYNKGVTWDSIYLTHYSMGMSFINRDTGWISGANEYNYHAIFRTTNAGITFIQQTDTTGRGNLFFLKNKVNGEYIGWHYSYLGDDLFWKTTNSGVNWFKATRPPAQYPGIFQFYDENTGWVSAASYGGGMYKSTNGGINWTLQTLPSGNGINSLITYFKIINSDTIYGIGGSRTFSNNIYFGLIWKSTNGGTNWGYQLPDTSFRIGEFRSIDFINGNTGWAYQGHGVHTTNGGGPVIYPTYIDSNSTIIPREYVLKQNYPNPFNPSTTIEFSLPKDSYVKLKILDLSGKTVLWVVYDMLLYSGLHKFKIVDFEKLKLSSGVYFYQMEARDINNQQLNFIQSRKMILLK